MSAKPDRITKLYEELTNKERASLAFRCLVDANELELSRLVATVPIRTYMCRDIEYQDWLERAFHLAYHWGMQHWRERTRLAESIVGLHIAANQNEYAVATQLLELHGNFELRLIALDRALEQVCQELGIDAANVRKITNAAPFVPMIERESCSEVGQLELIEAFKQVLGIH